MKQGTNGRSSREVLRLLEEGAVGRLTDGQLLDQYLEGPGARADSAFEALVTRHGPMVLGVCRRVLLEPSETQDAFQATFLLLARKAGSIRNRETLGGWLFGVARRIAVRSREQARRRQTLYRRFADSSLIREPPEPDHDPPEEIAALHDELDRLPARLRDPVVLCYLKGMSYEVAAQSLRLTESTIRGRLARARETLRTRLAHRGLSTHSLTPASFLVGPRWDLPTGWAEAATRASAQFARGGPTVGIVSVSALQLMQGVSRSMMLSKLRATSLIVSTLAGLGLAAGVFGHPPQEPGPPETRGGRVTSKQAGTAAADLARAVPGQIVRENSLTRDNMILAYIPDWAFGQVDNIGVANNDNGVRTLVAWPEIPEAEATSTKLRFFVALYSRKTDEGARSGPILAFEVTSTWPETTSWKTQPTYEPEPISSTPFAPGTGWKLFEITELVRRQKGKPGQGVLLRFLAEGSQGPGAWSGYQCVSREAAGQWADRLPRLLVVEPPRK